MTRLQRIGLHAFGVGVLAFASSIAPARAEDAPPAADIELAERLFVEGRVLAARGEHGAACARFAESRRLDPRAIGTVLNLAMCNDKLGRYASASRYYRDVAERSRGTREDRVELAEARLAEIEPKISTLRVVVPDELRALAITVTLDGESLPASAWGSPQKIDAGERVIEAHAAGKVPARLTVVVPETRSEETVTIPMLADAPIAPAPAAATTIGRSAAPPSRTLPLALGGAGLAIFVVSTGLGVTVAAECGGVLRNTCKALDEAADADVADKRSALRTRLAIATAGVAVGAAAIATGAVLYIATSPNRGVKIVPAASTTGASLGVHGHF